MFLPAVCVVLRVFVGGKSGNFSRVDIVVCFVIVAAFVCSLFFVLCIFSFVRWLAEIMLWVQMEATRMLLTPDLMRCGTMLQTTRRACRNFQM